VFVLPQFHGREQYLLPTKSELRRFQVKIAGASWWGDDELRPRIRDFGRRAMLCEAVITVTIDEMENPGEVLQTEILVYAFRTMPSAL
jgi:hypothetical protein